jgi:putative transcriptional regulator
MRPYPPSGPAAGEILKEISLRDLRRNTELLIMVELVRSPSTRLKEIGDRLGITVQAVSQYINAMRKEGLVRESRGTLRPTKKGMQLLQEHFARIKQEVDGILRGISVVDRCVAIAGSRIRKGRPVGLLMEDGMMMAFEGMESSSTGLALEDAEEGDDVHIGSLEGILDFELGKLLVLEAPSEVDGGSKAANVEMARQRVEDFSPGLLAAGDTIGAALLMKASGEMLTLHAPVESSMSALSKGVDVVYCGTRESTELMIAAVSKLKTETGYDIKWRTYRL